MPALTIPKLVEKLRSYFMYARGDTQIGGNITPDADKAYNIGSPSRRLSVIYADTVDANVSAGTFSGSTWSHPGDMTIDPKVDNATTTLFVLNSGVGGVANLNVENDIIVGGLVDGVDVASLKSSYDSHVASADSHHNAFVGLKDDVGSTVSPDPSDLIQIVGGNGLSSVAGASTLTLSVNVGDGIQIVSDAVAVDSTVVRTSRQVIAGQGLVGGGSLSADVTLDVNVGASLQIVSDAVQVNQGYSFNWSAVHNWGGGVSLDPAGAVSAPGSLRINIDSDNNTTNAALVFGKDGGGTLSTEIGRISENGDFSVSRDIRTGRYYLTPAGDIWARFTDELSGDASYIGAGGLTVIGGGESASAVLSGGGIAGSSERLVLASDVTGAGEAIRFVTSLQNGWASRVDAVSILGDGRVGIGTLTPNVQLDVVGSVNISNALGVNGAADIAEDLTVGAAYSTPGVLFVDVSQQNVGINRAPDNQFALDVSGPARADWWVGPHALQLSDAKMIVHFDGPLPYEEDFTGFAVGHAGQQPNHSSNTQVYRPGKFGKALQIAVGTKNLIPNPVFGYDDPPVSNGPVAGWNFANAYGGVVSYGTTSERRLFGKYSAFQELDGTQTGYVGIATTAISDPSIVSGAVFVQSGWVFFDSYMSHIYLILRCYDSSGNFISDLTKTYYPPDIKSGEWNFVYIYGTLPVGTSKVSCQFRIPPDYVGKVYFDGAQLENKPYTTPLAYGDMPNHSWAGTPHLSASTRTDYSIQYADMELRVPFTVAGWFGYAHDVQAEPTGSQGDRRHFFIATPDRSTSITVYMNDGDQPYALATGETVALNGGDGNTWPAYTWKHWAITVDGSGNATLYLDGTQVSTASWPSTKSVVYDIIEIGYFPGGGYTHNGWVDDLVVLDRAASADEIRAIYESNAPVFAESSVFAFRAPAREFLWVDDEGMWARLENGRGAFGLYLGDATKSWAGLTLDPGDLVIGDASIVGGGYIHFKPSTGSMSIVGDGSGITNIDGGNIQTRTITADKIVSNSLTSAEIAAGAITTSELAANSVTSDKINVAQLSAISADMGLLNAGEIRIGTGTIGSNFTGHRFWTDTSGVGRIAGYNNNVIQWEGATDGKLKAGSGSVVADSSGLSLFSGGTKIAELDSDGLSFLRGSGHIYWLVDPESTWAGQGEIRVRGLDDLGTLSTKLHIEAIGNPDIGYEHKGRFEVTVKAYNEDVSDTGVLYLESGRGVYGGAPKFDVNLQAGSMVVTSRSSTWSGPNNTVHYFNLNGIIDFKWSMGDSSKDPRSVVPDDWVEVRIGGTTYYLPAYLV